MAIHPGESFYTQDTLQPGARGETFIANLPGFRGEEDRVNRTNTHLNVSQHDVPNIKWDMDDRLPALFRYGFAYGFNQIITPKGRVMAVDPNMSTIDFDTKVQHNVLTMANGGVPVKVRATTDVYKTLASATDTTGLVSTDASGKAVVHPAKEWAPVAGMKKAYTDKYFRPFIDNTAKVSGDTATFVSPAAQLTAAGYSIDSTTGRVVNSSNVTVAVRPGNIPIGVLERNEYTRDIDAYNGMMPGPIVTDAMIELPWFLYKDKAEASFWGSAYGNLFPGALVKSDENGRLCVSPLSDPDVVATMSLAEYEAERRQVVGEIYSATKTLVPEGAAKWATWALEDRLNFDEFNPETWRKTNRKNEDNINNSPYASTGEYPGYPFDKAFNNSNLHMINDSARNGNYNTRMDQEYQYSDLGIPGLTDGYNVALSEVRTETIGDIYYRGDSAVADNKPYIDQIMQVSDVFLAEKTLKIKLGDYSEKVAVDYLGQFIDNGDNIFQLTYVDEKQGLIKIHIPEEKWTAADTVLKAASSGLAVSASWQKRGMAGVPTFLDWDGVVGSCKILLTK